MWLLYICYEQLQVLYVFVHTFFFISQRKDLTLSVEYGGDIAVLCKDCQRHSSAKLDVSVLKIEVYWEEVKSNNSKTLVVYASHVMTIFLYYRLSSFVELTQSMFMKTVIDIIIKWLFQYFA